MQYEHPLVDFFFAIDEILRDSFNVHTVMRLILASFFRIAFAVAIRLMIRVILLVFIDNELSHLSGVKGLLVVEQAKHCRGQHPLALYELFDVEFLFKLPLR